MPTLDELFEVLYAEDPPVTAGAARATSLRLPEGLHRAATIATELGMDASLTAATSHALLDRIRSFARGRAIAEHLAVFPLDRPSLAAVVQRRLSGTDHPADRHRDLVADVAERLEQRHPDWAVSGEVDRHVDRVIETVEVVLDREQAASGAASGAAN